MTLEWLAPAVLHDTSVAMGIASRGLQMLFEKKPALPSAILGRRAILVAFDLDLAQQADVSLRDRIDELIPRFETSYAGVTPLWVAGSFASYALPLRNLRYRPRKGYVLGTVAGAEGGMIFVSNVDETLIVGPRWDDAERFMLGALDELLGPPDA